MGNDKRAKVGTRGERLRGAVVMRLALHGAMVCGEAVSCIKTVIGVGYQFDKT